MQSNKKIIAISGPSGVGKTTIARSVIDKIPLLSFSVSACTRPFRAGIEKQGVDYYFISLEEFKTKIERGELIEYQEVYKGYYYGTLKSEINRIWNIQKHALLDIDVFGSMNIKKIYGEKSLLIFLRPPSLEIHLERLKKRSTETEESLKIRVKKIELELQQEDKFNVVVVNDKIEKAIVEVIERINLFINKT